MCQALLNSASYDTIITAGLNLFLALVNVMAFFWNIITKVDENGNEKYKVSGNIKISRGW